MKRFKLKLLAATFICLMTAVSCRHKDESANAPVFTKLEIKLNSRYDNIGPDRLVSSGVATAMISVVPESIYPVTALTDLEEAFDRQLLDLSTETVTVTVPLETSIRIAKTTYGDEYTVAEIMTDLKLPEFIGVSEPFTIDANATSKEVELIMEEMVFVIVSPLDGEADVAVDIPLVFTFSHTMDTSSITTNEGTGTCTGTLQLSDDDFSTCVPLGAPVAALSNTLFTVTPSSSLDTETTYKAKVQSGTLGVETAEGSHLSVFYKGDYIMTSGFTTGEGTSLLMGEGIQGAALSLNGIVTTLAGSGNSGTADDTGILAEFNSPHDICTDGTYIYVADKSGNTIRRIAIATGEVDTIAGTGAIGAGDGPGTTATFYQPAGITTDGTYLYVADQVVGLIRRIEIGDDWTVETLAGGNAGGGTPCSGSNTTDCKDGTGYDAMFNEPTGITYADGILYVAEMANNRIRKIIAATGVVSTLAGEGTAAFLDHTTGILAKFSDPHDLTTDGTNVYVIDQNNNRIREIVIATGVVTTLAGDGDPASTDSSDGTGATAQLNEPEGITTDGTYLYFTDWGVGTLISGIWPLQSVLRRTEISTGNTETIAGGSTTGYDCDGNDQYCSNGTGTDAQFQWAHDLTTDGTYLYLADFYNDRIRRIE